MICTTRPHNPPEPLTESRHKVTPSVNPRSRSGSTSKPRVMVESVMPGPVTSPSGVTGAIDTGVVVAVVGVVVVGFGSLPALQPEVTNAAASSASGTMAGPRRVVVGHRKLTRSRYRRPQAVIGTAGSTGHPEAGPQAAGGPR